MSKNRILGLLGLIGAGFVGGAILPLLIREGTSLMHPLLVNWLRITLGLPILLWLLRGKQSFDFLRHKKHVLLAIILGIGISINMTMFSFGVSRTTLIASQLVYVFAPVAATLLAYLLLGETVNRRKIFGMTLALLGVFSLLLFSRNPNEELSLGTFTGNFIIFVGMLGYTIYMIFSKKLSSFYSVLQMVLITNLTASILLFPLALYGLYSGGVTQLTFQSLGVMVALALSALAFMSFSQLSIRHLSAHTASLSSLLSPEFAALAGIIIYGERISAALLLSMVLSISGTYISVSAEKSTFLARIKTLLGLPL